MNLREELSTKFTEPQVTTGLYSPEMLSALYHALVALARAETDAVLLIGRRVTDQSQLSWAMTSNAQTMAPIFDPATSTILVYGLGPAAGFVLWAEPAISETPSPRMARRIAWSYDPTVLHYAASVLEPHMGDQPRRWLADCQRRFPPQTPALSAVQQFTNSLLHDYEHGVADSVLAHQTLQSQLQWREDMVRMIVHDVRAPLHTLMISIKNLLARDLPVEMQQELLEVANDTTSTLHSLCDSLLEITRLETGRWPLHYEPVDLIGVARNLCRSFEVAASHEYAPIAIEAGVPTLQVRLDRRLFERIVVNLLSNAVKYTPVDGQIRLVIDCSEDDSFVTIKVHDTGAGIDPEALPFIFDRFFQAHNENRHDGIGFGLYFARLAVQALGGSIDATSILGHGSTFTLTLPRSPECSSH